MGSDRATTASPPASLPERGRLTNDARETLHRQLVDGFDQDGFQVVVGRGLGLEPDQVVTEGTLEAQVLETIVWAETHGRVEELLDAARDRSPEHQGLAELVLRFEPPPPKPPRLAPVWRWVVNHFSWTRAGALVAGLIATVAGLLQIMDALRPEHEPPLLADRTIVSVRSDDEIDIDLLEGATYGGGIDSLVVELELARSVEEGPLTMLDDGRTVRYAAPADYVGPDRFAYFVRDPDGGEIRREQAIVVRQGIIGGSPAVAVMELQAIGDNLAAEDLAREASARVSGLVEAAFQTSGFSDSYRFVGWKEMGRLQEQVEDLATTVGADLVIHGTSLADSNSSEVELRFYLSPEEITNAQEVADDYPLMTIDIGVSGTGALIDEIDTRLPPTLDALTAFLDGVRMFNRKDFTKAQEQLEQAANAWPTPDGSRNGKQAVLMLLGNIELEESRLPQADDYYRQVLELAPESLRARFGRAEVRFLQALGPRCAGTGPVEIDQLESALADFEKLSEAEESTPFVAPRAAVEVGRVNQCLHQYDGRGLDIAAQAYESVILRYGDDDSLREIVAETHQRLAAVHVQEEAWTKAAASYEEAIEFIRGDSDKQAEWHQLVARIYRCELNDDAQALYHDSESQRLSGNERTPLDCEE